MKTQISSRLLCGLFLLTLLVFSQNSLAQSCTEGTGLASPTDTTGGHTAVGQSFTADCGGGAILSVSLVIDTSRFTGDDRQLNIYDGPDWTSAVLHTQLIPIASVLNGANTFTLTAPVAINPGETNSFEITAVGGGLVNNIADGVRYQNNNDYAGGEPFWSRSILPALELTFEVEIGVSDVEEVTQTIPVPTLSEIGILVLILSLLTVGLRMTGRERRR